MVNSMAPVIGVIAKQVVLPRGRVVLVVRRISSCWAFYLNWRMLGEISRLVISFPTMISSLDVL